eukprot:scaffold48_cov311-Pinguiococcus_pyrenoidosus.AAC.155
MAPEDAASRRGRASAHGMEPGSCCGSPSGAEEGGGPRLGWSGAVWVDFQRPRGPSSPPASLLILSSAPGTASSSEALESSR